ncbi:MAG TPA: gfo/Idh/MocA family oxidoreductase, partial [Blastocatellia bacterium]|nr:gfo/Idh/MocA family oxidoreductase [Blastocatellia bacterium]
MKRRKFIVQSLQGAASLAITAASARRILGANDRIRLGLIGCGGRGMDVAESMRKVPGVEYGLVCDV